MLIKNAGILSKKYFNAYFRLLLNTRECTVEEAKEMIWKRLFAGDKNALGSSSYQNFIEAYQQWKESAY